MKGQIKSIDAIKNMAVFKDFSWSKSVRDKDNNVAEFKTVNIIYGRNYSGKTTLSRIVRALETGTLSSNYNQPEFKVSFRDLASATSTSLTAHGECIRVFNEDFVRENLRFIGNESESINSFAILGEDNARIENEILELMNKLGSPEDTASLLGKYRDAEIKYNAAIAKLNLKSEALETKLKDKANKAGTGIKHNKLFGDANYNVNKLKADISAVSSKGYSALSQEQSDEYHALLREDAKEEIPPLASFELKLSGLAEKVKELVERKITIANPLQELLGDAALESWVRSGRELHRGRRESCGFCGNQLPADLWEKLDQHFNLQSENLRIEIEATIKLLNKESDRIPGLLKIKRSDFYANFTKSLDELESEFNQEAKNYQTALDSLTSQLSTRLTEIHSPLVYSQPARSGSDLNSLHDEYEALREQSNDFATKLVTEQKQARHLLRLNEVYTFYVDIKYSEEAEAIDTLESNKSAAAEVKEAAQIAVKKTELEIKDLKSQLKDESKGADKVNEYLNSFFGHNSLKLEAFENSGLATSGGYRFEVTRSGKKAFHLSEGECSLIAFCYFLAKLSDYETKGTQPIIWIDDPICSLDSNHIFFTYSLIHSEIIEPEKYDDGGEIKERSRFKQIFVSTHNLDFLKYLKRLPGAGNKKESQYFTINRADDFSEIKVMPDYLKNFVTEFNYLFSQIHTCASIDIIDDQNYTAYYNSGNNARKFFEIYLYYKYPNKGMTDETMEAFFGENIPAILTDRINNEYSHLAGVFERGATPTEVPEMKRAATHIIERLRLNDPDQYSSLLDSIGVAE
ncbi:AAA family ATPase [Pseudomonas aeruginosa]|nr:AAA family ATPase [Pseudomonas aeruginosa]MCS8967067.1 AAA family ATPase [Pseudomonas aeruginosa]MCS9313484.1 AAA family ATPase [Pseudomonas aeruginosa]MCS9979709.1 AAA family ATPase [Pseudomonas aeruginosa]